MAKVCLGSLVASLETTMAFSFELGKLQEVAHGYIRARVRHSRLDPSPHRYSLATDINRSIAIRSAATFRSWKSISGQPVSMFCPLVSSEPLRRAQLLSDSAPPSTASYRAAVVGPSTPPAVSRHVAVDIPDGYDDDEDGEDSDIYELEKTTQHISPVGRVLAKVALVAYTAFAAPTFVVTAATRSSSWLQVLLVVVLVLLTFLSLFRATLYALEDEDREREERERWPRRRSNKGGIM
ncbi:hypothetical protein ACQJBY_053343 [Aegilops geniculata]